MRAFAIVALCQYPNRIGYSMVFVGAVDEDYAIACGIRAIEQAQPDAKVLVPSASEITLETLAEIDVNLCDVPT